MAPRPIRRRFQTQPSAKAEVLNSNRSHSEKVIKKMLELLYTEYINSIPIDHTSEKNALKGLIRRLGYNKRLSSYSVEELRELAETLHASKEQFDELQYEKAKKFTMDKWVKRCLKIYRKSLEQNKNEHKAKKNLFNKIIRDISCVFSEENFPMQKLVYLEQQANVFVRSHSEDQVVQSSTNNSNPNVQNKFVSRHFEDQGVQLSMNNSNPNVSKLNGGKKSISKKTKKVRKHQGIYQKGSKKVN